jgi:hypothetical protein
MRYKEKEELACYKIFSLIVVKNLVKIKKIKTKGGPIEK